MYRDQWSRYTRGSCSCRLLTAKLQRRLAGCDGILFVVDTYARERLPEARKELHRLLEDRALATTPILICANKIDLEPHVDEAELIKGESATCTASLDAHGAHRAEPGLYYGQPVDRDSDVGAQTAQHRSGH